MDEGLLALIIALLTLENSTAAFDINDTWKTVWNEVKAILENSDQNLAILVEADKAEAHDGHHGHEGKSASGNEEYGFFGVPWAVPDFVVGLAMGAYGPVNARTRDGDCFSKWYDWGLAMVGLSDYFTKSFDVNDW